MYLLLSRHDATFVSICFRGKRCNVLRVKEKVKKFVIYLFYFICANMCAFFK